MSNMYYKGLLSVIILGGYFLIFIAHYIIEFGFTNLTKYFGVYLSSMAVCSIFIVLLGVLFPFCLFIRKDMEGCTSIDNTIRWECSSEL
jgi:hypothetical protein